MLAANQGLNLQQELAQRTTITTPPTSSNLKIPGPAAIDSDNDGIPDFLDSDSDSDGVSDLQESGSAATQVTTLDRDGNGRIDSDIAVGSNGLVNL